MKIAIVAGAPSLTEAPYYNPDWRIWATGPLMSGQMPVVHRYFEVHPERYKIFEMPHFIQFMDTSGAEIWAHHPELYRNSVQYPVERIVARFGTEFLSSSVAWMMALAICEIQDFGDERNKIGLWGVDLVTSLEYRKQRPGVKHFMALARELGIEVTAPPDCPLMHDLPSYPPQ